MITSGFFFGFFKFWFLHSTICVNAFAMMFRLIIGIFEEINILRTSPNYCSENVTPDLFSFFLLYVLPLFCATSVSFSRSLRFFLDFRVRLLFETVVIACLKRPKFCQILCTRLRQVEIFFETFDYTAKGERRV